MNSVALRILLGDRAKYVGLIFGIAFSTMLMSNQTSIFIGLMLRTANQILDAREADIWVMDPRVDYVDEIEPMTDTQLGRVRGVDGVDWAVPFFIDAKQDHLLEDPIAGVCDGSKHRRLLQRRIRIVPAVRRARSTFGGMYCNPRRHTIGPLLPRPRPVIGPVPDR